jgi:threonine/homoserine/homoserine lactone efflux protein
MEPLTALVAFTLAAGLLTITPGLDMALVLRTAAVEGGRQALQAGAGIVAGCLAWGLAAALGLGMVLALSATAFTLLQLAGAAYLIWLGLGMLRQALRRPPAAPAAALPAGLLKVGARRWFARGLLTNLLNPKVGVFYISFLPQFIPAGVDVVGFSVLLAAIHGALGLAWFALLVLAVRPLADRLRRPPVARTLEGITGAVLLAFGLRLALDRSIAGPLGR